MDSSRSQGAVTKLQSRLIATRLRSSPSVSDGDEGIAVDGGRGQEGKGSHPVKDSGKRVEADKDGPLEGSEAAMPRGQVEARGSEWLGCKREAG